MQIGTKICNFTVTNVRPVPGKDAQLVEMRYEKTGTELCWVRSKEANKLFCIGFKTIPEDDTGVFHILEHSVLCGSDKYPVKEPFVELLKSSMNTFLNAMTYPDKTIYPVASRNEQDFLNLTGVYLDAVFAPAILHEPNIYRQEGWHYELDGENLTYNGVVFNEMKGAMSSVDEVCERGIMHLLFPDNCYQYNSGGEPAAIPNLTYQQFVDSYRKYYHPTNARIFLDGDIPVEKTFALLDEYLCRYDMGEKQHLSMQDPVAHEETVLYEAVNDGTPKAQLVLGKILGDYTDKTGLIARQVLCDALAGSNDAPLKKAVMDTGLCQDMSFVVYDGMIQQYMTLRLQNMEAENADRLEEVIRNCARELVENGIPKERLTASINLLSFRVRQMHEPQALIRCINSLGSWLYDGDPMLYLHYNESIDALRVMAQKGEFEALLREMLLDEAGLCKLHVLPSETYGADQRKAEADRLAAEKAAMSEEQLQNVADTFDAFTAWQQKPDSEEGLATLPKLTLDQIAPEPVRIPTQPGSIDGVTLLQHKADTNGIVYMSAYFRLTDATMEELTQLSFLCRLLGQLPTANYTADQLQNELKTWLGDVDFAVSTMGKLGDSETTMPVLEVHWCALEENLHKALQLMLEVLTATDLNQPTRIRQILLQTEMELQQRGMMSGHSLAIKSAQAHFSAGAAVNDAVSGITYIRWLHALSKDFDAQLPTFLSGAGAMLKKAICRARLTLSLTENGSSDLSFFTSGIPAGNAVPESAPYTSALPKKLGIRIPAQVSFASTAFHLDRVGMQYDGTARVLSNILSLSCLWNEVRVQGGAYGAGMRVVMNGGVRTNSYRDPNPARSLEVYRNMGDFVRSFAASGADITGYIISTIADTEPLMGPAPLAMMEDANYFAGFDYEMAVEERRQMLHTTTQQLLKWCVPLDALREHGSVCVVGYADALDACKHENLTIYDI